jgi:site-specific DNA recombinase
MSKQAAIYTRVSTSEQSEEGYSLPEQERAARELIAREGWEHVETFEDAGKSGSDRERPALKRLLDSVAAGRIDVVVFKALDRLGRDAGHLREMLLLFDAAGVHVASLREDG